MRNPWGRFEYDGAWAPRSSNWTESIKSQVDFSVTHSDPGLFYISWKEYVSAFRNTTICVEADHKKYNHTGQIMLDLNEEEKPFVFLRFKLDSDYNCSRDAFAINFYQ